MRWPALLAALLLLATPLALGHPAASPPGYSRMVHDCADDYGAHDITDYDPNEPGHGLASIDVQERTQDGKPMFLVRITVNDQATQDTTLTREEIRFETPRKTGADAISTLLRTPKNGEGTSITFVSGVQPAYLATGLDAYEASGGTDGSRFGFEVGYTYEQLQVQNDEHITAFTVTGHTQAAIGGAWTQRDHMPGGYYSAGQLGNACDPATDSDHYVATSGHKVTASDWTPAGGGNNNGGDDGNASEDPPPGTGSGANNQPPIADFAYTPANPSTADEVRFTDRSVDHDGALIEWTWDFGDGSTGSGAAATHRYADDGTYTIRLYVTDDDNAQRSVNKQITVVNQRPTARIETPPRAIAGEPLSLTDASTDADGRIATRTWDLGDGTTSNQPSPTHTYDTPGTYTVTLTVTDDDGATATTTKALLVRAASGETAPGPAFLLTTLAALALLAWTRRRQA